MTSSIYLFGPAPSEAEKPLVQLLREAEVGRSKEAARMARSLVARISDFFERTTSEKDHVEPRQVSHTDSRLAA